VNARCGDKCDGVNGSGMSAACNPPCSESTFGFPDTCKCANSDFPLNWVEGCPNAPNPDAAVVPDYFPPFAERILTIANHPVSNVLALVGFFSLFYGLFKCTKRGGEHQYLGRNKAYKTVPGEEEI